MKIDQVLIVKLVLKPHLVTAAHQQLIDSLQPPPPPGENDPLPQPCQVCGRMIEGGWLCGFHHALLPEWIRTQRLLVADPEDARAVARAYATECCRLRSFAHHAGVN